MKTWDEFIIPYPFSRGVFIFGEPLSVSKNASEKEEEEKRKQLENELIRITDIANSYFDKL